MKTKIIFIVAFLLGFVALDLIGQENVKAKNDTLYFEDQKVFVPKYPKFKVMYFDSKGKSININRAPNGTYVREFVSKEFRIVEFYNKTNAKKKD